MSELVDSIRRVGGLLNAVVQMERESSTLGALLDLDLGYLIDEDARKGELHGGSTPAVGGGEKTPVMRRRRCVRARDSVRWTVLFRARARALHFV